jgi:hypothetical protein
MAKKMELAKSDTRVDLVIERDAGNPVRILMGGKDKATIRNTWKTLKSLCDEALKEVDELVLLEKWDEKIRKK